MGESRPTYQFGPFRLEVDRRRLLRDDAPVALASKAIETLLALIEHRDRVLTKDELLQRIWGDTIVEEGGLARNISVLRKALGETPDDHHYILTVPGRGYRFVADVAVVGEPAEETPAVEASAVAASNDLTFAAANTMADPRRRRWPWRWVALGGLAALAAGALVYGLRPLHAVDTGRPRITALAVLPLDNLSGDPTQEYFADGMTDALIGNLARIRALRVVSRTSVMRFKGVTRSLPEIARTLKVDAIVEGSVQRSGDRVRITIQLLDAPTDTHLWTREYERELTDVLKLQGEVARAVAEEIQVQITAEERARLASAGAVNPAAYQEYLLGQHHLWRLNEEDLSRAIDHFERAIRLDPGYAAAHAGLSHAWWWRGIHGSKTARQVESPSRAAAQRALALDPQLAEAHVSTGRIKFNYEWDWTGAEKEFGRALELDPNSLDAHFFHGMLFMALGRFPESIAHIERAEQLDPLSATVQSGFGRILYRARRFDEAIVHLKQAIDLDPQNAPYYRLADVMEEKGQYAEAMALNEKADKLRGRLSEVGPNTARIYARMGRRDEAKEILARQQTSTPALFSSATAHAALGNKDEAFQLLFKLSDERDSLNYVKTDPRLDSLHSDPRWQVLLRRMNLPTDPDSHTARR
jgi:TolB-like protein/DNA-binding winged helix-turn-helix (wHTH) protein/Tfp pilus assembly protein PilF